MNITLKAVCIIAALVCFGLYTFGVTGKINTLGAGAFCFTLAGIV